MTTPLASCLMVTQRGREHLAAAAIGDFFRQDYPNRELVIAVTDDETHHELGVVVKDWQYNPPDVDTTAPGASRTSPHVSFARVPETSLGELRNETMAHADDASRFFVQWDDDDRHHPRRVSAQLAAFAPGDVAVCLSSQLYYFVADRVVYLVDWFRRLPKYKSVLIPGTIAVRADVALASSYPTSGPASRKGEDGAHLQSVLGRGGARALGDGSLYLRQFHGANTWGLDHFRANAHWLGLPAVELRAGDAVDRIKAAFSEARYVDTPGPVTIMGGDGVVATIFEN